MKLAAVWPIPNLPQADFIRYRAAHRTEMIRLVDMAEKRLDRMAKELKAELPNIDFAVQLDGHWGWVDIAAARPPQRYSAGRIPVAGCDKAELRAAIERIVNAS